MYALLMALACEVPTDTNTVKDADTEATATDIDGDGFSTEEGDCDDTDPSAAPGLSETCDSVDNDCDGEVDEGFDPSYVDSDGDGYGDPLAQVPCDVDTGKVADNTDCDDDNDAVSPAANESCNGIDDDCDGTTDEGVEDTWYADADGDGFGDANAAFTGCERPSGYVDDQSDCDDTRADASPGGTEVCDEIDNDCDSEVDEGVTTDFFIDTDGDGHGSTSAVQPACAVPTGYSALSDDCDDTSSSISPSATEWCNGVDDDCDGTTDEADASDAGTWYADVDGDGYGDPDGGTTACDAPPGTVDNGDDCNDADAALNPGTAWYIDVDGDGYGSATYVLYQCDWPSGYVSDSSDCDDTDASVNPGTPEVCNGIDDDCNGVADDDDVPADPSTWYADADGDGYGDDTSSVS
mgnify:CR=1 FL=1